MIPLACIFGTLTFAKLRLLEIRSIISQKRYLADFLVRHKATLRTLLISGLDGFVDYMAHEKWKPKSGGEDGSDGSCIHIESLGLDLAHFEE